MLQKTGQLDGIIAALPSSRGLSLATQEAMPVIIETKLLTFDQLAALFNKRFDRTLTHDETAGLTYDAIAMVWKQLDRLPPAFPTFGGIHSSLSWFYSSGCRDLNPGTS